MSEKEIELYGKQVDEIKIRPYEHHAKYYETDQMGIIHHSNYIKWMEEARMDLMDQIGLSYKEMEAMEIISRCCRCPASITVWFILMMWLSLSRGLPSIMESRWKWSTG